jgi:preprotein translocase subunit YajC
MDGRSLADQATGGKENPFFSIGKVEMRILIAVASVSLALAAPLSPALAQASGGFAVGAQVTDANGGPVGTVTAVNGDIVTIKTDKFETNLSKSSFAEQDGKLLIGMTQVELNAAIEKDKAAAEASLAVGAPVKDSAGASAGTIEAIDAEFVTLKLASGKSVRLPRNGIAGSANGAVVGIAAADLEAQAK